ncbi:MAG: hypothetical protein HYV90_01440 [Candidatus Woesebacteria bacterium]|nr:MAG: hypothetical protein HYV90_01440 [Candidatus Woesebacteria bacterium]
MKSILIENKTSYDLAMKLLGTTNIIKTTYLFVKWVVNPQKNVKFAHKLVSEIKASKDQEYLINTVYPRAIAIGYLNEFYAKYLAYGKSNQEIISINKKVDRGTKTNNNLINTLIELRKYRLAVKKMITGSNKKDAQNDQVIKTVKTFGVSDGVVKGKALNITSERQTIPKNCIGIFPTAGTKYTRQFSKCIGIILLNGGVTSHGAILAREFNIPAIVSPKLKISDGTNILIDGSTGKITISDTFSRSP